MKSIVLASSSPRRRELLKPFFNLTIRPAEIDESIRRGEYPRSYVKRMAIEKFEAVALNLNRPSIVVAADTIVVLEKTVFGKPKNQKDAERILKKLSGRTHQVITAVTVGWGHDPRSRRTRLVSTSVRFRKISKAELSNYLRSKEFAGKAGAYGIQGAASKFVAEIRGSLTNVVGLPLEESMSLIAHMFSHPIPSTRASRLSLS